MKMLLVLLLCVLPNVLGQSVRTKCPEKCLCFRTTVRCMFVQLTSIPEVPPATAILDLRFNRITKIQPGVFRNLSSLNTLLLNNNHITGLQEGAFDGLTNLRYLYLYKNRIRRIDAGVFKNMDKLEQLYLHFNDISSFDADTFSSLPALQRLFLHNNRLQRVPSGAFKSLGTLRRLRLDSNALVCDCELLWLAEMAQEHSHNTLVAATCEAPSPLHGKSLMSLTDREFHCKGMPHIREGPQDVEVSFGGTASFSCRVDGDPSPDVVWLHNNEVISNNQPRYSVQRNGTLTINNAQTRDLGYYECRANNTMGQAVSRRAKVSMHSAPHTRAEIVGEPMSQNVTQGSYLRLPCNVTGYPAPQVTWGKEGNGVLILGDRITVSEDHSLVFRQVLIEDTGVYSCSAQNPLGQMSAFAAIRVIVVVDITGPPVDQVVSLGGSAHFTCRAVGHPVPTLHWYKGDLELNPNAKYSISIGGEALRVVGISATDEGPYTCLAKNELMADRATAYLKLAQTALPVIMKEPLDQTVVTGQPLVSLDCRVDGLPAPTVSWMKDGRPMDGPTHHYSVTPEGSLLVYNVSSADAGSYECVAQNDVGHVSAVAQLTVNEDPITPGLGDRFFTESFLEANAKVNRALNMTISQLFSRDRPRGAPLPHELLRVFRFPHSEGREIARAAEKIEQTLQIVHRHVQSGKVFSNLTNFRYQDLLSAENIEVLTNLSGCLAHRRAVSCNDMCFHLKYRTIDGTCNNLDNPVWGSSLTGFRRLLPPIYENGFNSPVGWSKTKVYHGYFKPNPRLVSTRIVSNEESTEDTRNTHMLMQWGQFLDHDMDHALPSISTESFTDGSQCQRSCEYSAPCFPIEIPYDDPRVYRHRCMEFTRSSAVCGSGMTSVFFNSVLPREQINQLTSFIDASQVYGSSYSETQTLRNFTHNFGQLRIGISMPSGKPLMPFSAGAPIDCRRDRTESAVDCFLAGDVRANEQTALLAMHTVWFREHNRMAEKIRDINPHWDGDTIFHETRKILGGLMQHITYNHWLPRIVGPQGMEQLGPYKGYDSTLEPTISNSFATAAFRFGHSLVNPLLHRLNSSFQPTRDGPLPLHKAFFSPWRLVQEGGVDPLLRGLFATPAKLKIPGQFLNTELTEKLFQSAHEIALDLAAMNIQRGRDHALPGYLEWRKFCNLSSPNSFDGLALEIKSPEIREKLRQLYGHPGNVDLWVGALLEDSLPGARVGPTVSCLLVEQFRRLRDGDRFWYENLAVFKPEQLVQIKRMTLGRVICNAGDDIQDVTKDVFELPHLQSPSFVPCKSLPDLDLRLWAECCKDCRNAGYFNSLIRTPGLRLRRSVDYSLKEDWEDQQFSLYNEVEYSNSSFSSNSVNYEDMPKESLDKDLQKVALENQRAFQKANRHYGFISHDPDGDMDIQQADSPSVIILEAQEPVSTFRRGGDGPMSRGNAIAKQPVEEPAKSRTEVEASEERIEGLESMLGQLMDTVKKLSEKVVQLEGLVTEKLAPRRKPRKQFECRDTENRTRSLGEQWNPTLCTRCSCKRKGVRCRVLRCPRLHCKKQVTLDDSCCPMCDISEFLDKSRSSDSNLISSLPPQGVERDRILDSLHMPDPEESQLP